MPTKSPSAPSVLDVRRLRDTLGLSRERMGRLFGVSSKTIERWEGQCRLPTNDPLRMERLAAVQEIADLGTKIYTSDGFVDFMRLPMPVFSGLSALQLIERGEAETVLGALASDYEGVGY